MIDFIQKTWTFDGHEFLITFDYSDNNYGAHVDALTPEGKEWLKTDASDKLYDLVNKEF